MNWEQALLAFAEQTRQRLRPRTIEMALGQVKRFRDLHPKLSGPDQVQPEHLMAFLQSESQRANVKTAWHNLTDLKCFFLWATRARVVHWNPAANFKRPKFPSGRQPLSYDQVEAVLKLAQPQSRNAALLEVFYGTGLRLGEAYGLDITDVSLSQCYLNLRNTKGGRARLVPIGDHLAEVLRHYLEHIRPQLLQDVSEPALWLSSQGGGRLSQDQIAWILSQLFREARLVGASAHSLRHSYATHLLEGGAPLQVVQTLLGHQSVLATRAYAHVLQGELLREYRRTHPRARRKRSRARAL